MVDELDYAIKDTIAQGIVSSLRERLVTSLSRGCSETATLSKKTTVEFGQVEANPCLCV